LQSKENYERINPCHKNILSLFYDMRTRYVYGETLCFVLYRKATPFKS